jgi:general secretion pathway protein D
MMRRSLTTLAALLCGTAAWAQQSETAGPDVRTTILPGAGVSRPTPARSVQVLPTGDITLNFPGVDVQEVAKAVLGDTLNVPFTVDPAVHALVNVRTTHPIRRADVIGFFEQALTSANLVLVNHNGTYAILTVNAARAQAPSIGPGDQGFGNETLRLRFVNADEMKKLIDPLVPGAVASSDPTQNTLVISGDATQRKALRDLVAEFDVDWLKGMSFALYVPQRTDARLIAPELEKLLNGPGAPTAGLVRIIAMDSLNGILAISSQPQYLEDTRRFVEVLDREGESAEKRFFVYRVQNGKAADLAKVINGAFGIGSGASGSGYDQPPALDDRSAPAAASLPPPPPTAPGAPAHPAGGDAKSGQSAAAATISASVTADDANNAVVVYATPRDYALIADALNKLDVPPMQVMIDASIDEVTLDHNTQYGLQWEFQAGGLNGTLSQGAGSSSSVTNPITGLPIYTNPGPIQNFPGLSFLYQGNGIEATLNALKTVNDVKVLSAPKLMVMNNHTASIEVGNEVPISTGSALNITTSAPIVNSIEYRDTGIILKITPRVNSGGLVLLDIAQEVSDVENTSTSGIDSPTFEQRKIATSVAVQDGETIALGGLIKNQVTKGRSTVPILGDIPVLGHLLGDTTGSLVRTELVVLLTPHVVRAPVDARAVTRELIEKIHEGAPTPLFHAPKKPPAPPPAS